jgi:prophage antirepressor-like protein
MELLMSTALVSKTFLYGEKPVRTIQGQDGKPWYCLIDVCSILQYKNHRDAMRKHCKCEGVAKRDAIDNLGRNQETVFISEPNLCRLVCKSKLPEALKFEAWVFDVLIPSAMDMIRAPSQNAYNHDTRDLIETMDEIFPLPANQKLDYNPTHKHVESGFNISIQEYIELLKFKCTTLEMNVQKLQQPHRKNFTTAEINTVIEMKSQGFKNHEIAKKLDRSRESIRTLLSRLKQKQSLEITGRQ